AQIVAPHDITESDHGDVLRNLDASIMQSRKCAKGQLITAGLDGVECNTGVERFQHCPAPGRVAEGNVPDKIRVDLPPGSEQLLLVSSDALASQYRPLDSADIGDR